MRRTMILLIPLMLVFTSALFAADTPDKFRPLIGKWELLDPQRGVKFQVVSVDEDGNAVINYTAKAVEIPMKGNAFIDKAGKLHLVLEGGKMAVLRWELEFYPKGKFLFGTMKSSRYPETSEVKVYPAD